MIYVCAQVTRHNFDAAVKNIKEAVEECDFVAFDCEMTGLFLDNNEGSYLDDMPLRYYKVHLCSATCFPCKLCHGGKTAQTARQNSHQSHHTILQWHFD